MFTRVAAQQEHHVSHCTVEFVHIVHSCNHILQCLTYTASQWINIGILCVPIQSHNLLYVYSASIGCTNTCTWTHMHTHAHTRIYTILWYNLWLWIWGGWRNVELFGLNGHHMVGYLFNQLVGGACVQMENKSQQNYWNCVLFGIQYTSYVQK